MGMMGKPYSQYGSEPVVADVLEELRGSIGLDVYKNVAFLYPLRY